MPVEDMNASSKIGLCFRLGVIRLFTRNAKTNYIGKFIIINVITDNTIFIYSMLNIGHIGSYTINPTLYFRETHIAIIFMAIPHDKGIISIGF